jgi:hypothetical protein
LRFEVQPDEKLGVAYQEQCLRQLSPSSLRKLAENPQLTQGPAPFRKIRGLVSGYDQRVPPARERMDLEMGGLVRSRLPYVQETHKSEKNGVYRLLMLADA